MPNITSTGYALCQAVIGNGVTTGNEFSDPQNLLLTDGETAESNAAQASDVIVGNFPFALPQDAVITGFQVKFIAKRGGDTTPPITITPYAVKQSDSNTELFYPGDAVTISDTDLAEYVLGDENYIFNTTWTADEANNFKVQLVSNGTVFVDSVLVNVFYYIPASSEGEAEVSESCEDCSSPIQAQPFYLALPMTSTDLVFYLTSFNYPDGTEIQLEDLGECGGFLDFTFDEGRPKVQGSNFEENIRVTSEDALERLVNGTVKFTLAALSQRGLQFKTPYTASTALRSAHNANSKVILSNNGPFMGRYLQRCQIDSVVSAPITVSDENVELPDPAHNLDFRGPGVVAVNDITDPNKKIITIPGAGGTTPPGRGPTSSATSGGEEVTELDYEAEASGINRGMLIRVVVKDAVTVTDVLFGDNVLNQVATFNDGTTRVEFWFTTAPDIGTHTVHIELSAPSYIVSGATALFNVDQSSPIGNSTSQNGTGTAVSMNMSTLYPYSIVFDVLGTMDAPIIYTVGPGQAQDFQRTAVTDVIQGAGSDQPAGVAPDNVIMSWTLSKSADWLIGLLEIKGITATVPGTGQSAIQFEDEGTPLGIAGTVDEFDFVGAGVTAARVGDKVTVTIPGGGASLSVEQDGTPVETGVDTINFTGDVIVTNPSPGQVDVEIVGGGGSGSSNLADKFDDFIAAQEVKVGSSTAYKISGNFAAEGLSFLGEEDHPGIVRIDSSGLSNQLMGFAEINDDPDSSTNSGLLNFGNDFDVRWLARNNVANTVSRLFSLTDTAGIGTGDVIGVILADDGDVYYTIGAGAVSTAVPFPTLATWYEVRIRNVGGTVTITLDEQVLFTGSFTPSGNFFISNLQQDVVGSPTFDIDYVRTIYRDVSSEGSGTKIAVDTTEVTIPDTNTPTTLFTIPIPGGTLSTNNAVKAKLLVSGIVVAADDVITFVVTYGGETVGTVVLDGSNDGITSTAALLEIVLVADGATNAQKGIVSIVAKVDGNDNIGVSTGYAVPTVDSTVDQDLEVVATTSGSGGATTAIAQAILVEKVM